MRILQFLSIVASALVAAGSRPDEADRLNHSRAIDTFEQPAQDQYPAENLVQPVLTSSQLGLKELHGTSPTITNIDGTKSTPLRANSKHRQSDEEALCKTTVGDEYWPKHSVWMEVFPTIVEIPLTGNEAHPNYYLEAESALDVQNAVAFCNEKNIRLSIISSGLDYLGR